MPSIKSGAVSSSAVNYPSIQSIDSSRDVRVLRNFETDIISPKADVVAPTIINNTNR